MLSIERALAFSANCTSAGSNSCGMVVAALAWVLCALGVRLGAAKGRDLSRAMGLTRLLEPPGDPAPCLLEALPYRKDDVPAGYTSEYERFRDEFGYAVFGRVLDGMDVVDKIAATPTGRADGHDAARGQAHPGDPDATDAGVGDGPVRPQHARDGGGGDAGGPRDAGDRRCT